MNATTKPTHFFDTYGTPPCSQGLAAERSATWCEPDCFCETPPVFNEDAAAAYAEWQESVEYLLRELNNSAVDCVAFGYTVGE